MAHSPVEIERRGDVAVVRFARPEVHHAMNRELLEGLADTTKKLRSDDDVRAVVVTGGDRAFCAGGDLQFIVDYAPGPAAAVRHLAGVLHEAIVDIRRMPKPVIAAIRGSAAGAGMSLALACDLRVVGRSARFVLAYGSRGLSVDGGAGFSLPRLVGLARALEIAALDEPIDAERALALGLATRVVDDARVFEEALALADRLAARAVRAFGEAKRLFLESFETSLEVELDRERDVLAEVVTRPEAAEGIAAFREKRPPVFRRRKGGD